MKPIIAIQPDNQQLSSGRWQSFSTRWHELASRQGIVTREINVYSSAKDLFEQLNGCDAFMWWFAQPLSSIRPGLRIIAALVHVNQVRTFPDLHTIWHFDDKIAGYYLLRAAGIPTPRTWVLWTRRQAEGFLSNAEFPLVLKLTSGIVSRNVELLPTTKEAKCYVHELFGAGMHSLPPANLPFRWLIRRLREATRIVRSQESNEAFHNGYMLLQEFLPDNEFDIRITVIGNRAFAFRRFNRPNDFRASGSGRIDWDPAQIPTDALLLAYQTACLLKTQSLAVDILRREGKPVITEISYYYEGWAIEACPGHWEWLNSSESPEWVEGNMRPEDAIWEDFIASLGIEIEPV